jgi:hypothetical protein
VTQVPLQHWLLDAQLSPFGSQEATQTPAEQFPVQQVADNVHD